METNNRPKFCSKCGNKLPLDAAFCPSCGKRIAEAMGDLSESVEIQTKNDEVVMTMEKQGGNVAVHESSSSQDEADPSTDEADPSAHLQSKNFVPVTLKKLLWVGVCLGVIGALGLGFHHAMFLVLFVFVPWSISVYPITVGKTWARNLYGFVATGFCYYCFKHCGGLLKSTDGSFALFLFASIVVSIYCAVWLIILETKEACKRTNARRKVEPDSSGTESQVAQGNELFGFLKKLLWIDVALGVLATLIGTADVGIWYAEGRAAYIGEALFGHGLSVWVLFSVCSRKNWARRAYICLAIVAMVFCILALVGIPLSCCILSSSDSSLSLFGNVAFWFCTLASAAVGIICTVILFNKQVKYLFKQQPDTATDKFKGSIFWVLFFIYLLVAFFGDEFRSDDAVMLDHLAAVNAGSRMAKAHMVSMLADSIKEDGESDNEFAMQMAKGWVNDMVCAYKGQEGKCTSWSDLGIWPPITIDFLSGSIDDCAIRIGNDSEEKQSVNVYVYCGKGVAKFSDIAIEAGETKELHRKGLEYCAYFCGEGNFKLSALSNGVFGIVEVSGYNAFILFKIEDDKISASYDYVVPTDCPVVIKKMLRKVAANGNK